jgi:hypothetical protein
MRKDTGDPYTTTWAEIPIYFNEGWTWADYVKSDFNQGMIRLEGDTVYCTGNGQQVEGTKSTDKISIDGYYVATFDDPDMT